MTITPYADQYITVHYGNAGTVRVRSTRGTPTAITCPANSLSDLETNVYSAPWISDIGDVSSFYSRLISLTSASKLKELHLGSGAAGYQNVNLTAERYYWCYFSCWWPRSYY